MVRCGRRAVRPQLRDAPTGVPNSRLARRRGRRQKHLARLWSRGQVRHRTHNGARQVVREPRRFLRAIHGERGLEAAAAGAPGRLQAGTVEGAPSQLPWLLRLLRMLVSLLRLVLVLLREGLLVLPRLCRLAPSGDGWRIRRNCLSTPATTIATVATVALLAVHGVGISLSSWRHRRRWCPDVVSTSPSARHPACEGHVRPREAADAGCPEALGWALAGRRGTR
mmetsp:Transcript_155214/g.497785  ORF Transcript_155214/g.497785 Transcript_155214/m.497785 type:complete len:224 (-) Transcript_155214:760-1431(-)